MPGKSPPAPNQPRASRQGSEVTERGDALISCEAITQLCGLLQLQPHHSGLCLLAEIPDGRWFTRAGFGMVKRQSDQWESHDGDLPSPTLCTVSQPHTEPCICISYCHREITKSFLWGIFKTSSQAKLNFSFQHFAKAFRYILEMLLFFFLLFYP